MMFFPGQPVWYCGQSTSEEPYLVVGPDPREPDVYIIDGPPRSGRRLQRVHASNLKTIPEMHVWFRPECFSNN